MPFAWSPAQSVVVLDPTPLNGLVNGATSSILADISNTTGRDLYVHVWIVLGSLTPTAGGSLLVRLVPKRGANYATRNSTTFSGQQVSYPLTSTTGSKHCPFDLLIPGSARDYGIDVVNNSGATLASSSNLVEYILYNEDLK